MDLLQWLFDARIEFAGGQFILFREVLGNVFGLLSALGGMRRKVWAWPIGIAGNLLLLTVFLGTVFGNPNSVDLLGQARRQVMFIVTSVYGWVRWRQAENSTGTAVQPEWASWPTRILLVDRKSTRLNSSQVAISYAVFSLRTKRATACPRTSPGRTRHRPA